MRIGLYGGTFSPPHSGHVRAAKCFAEGGELDKLIIMPAGIPPHKIVEKPISANDRFNLVKLAFDGIGEVSDYEMNKNGASYTYLTLRWLKEQYPCDEIYLCMGEDMFLCLEKWKEYREIFDRCSILCLKRENSPASEIYESMKHYEKEYNAKIKVLTYEPLVISSTEIRTLAGEGKSIDHLVPAAVADYIISHRLYT